MRYDVKTLEGELLDAAVAKAEGLSIEVAEGVCFVVRSVQRWHTSCGVKIPSGFTEQATPFRPCTDWRDGGPIIEREGISIETGYLARMVEWTAMVGDSFSGNWPSENPRFTGPTPLIAAMRAYVARKFGDMVELP